MSTLRMLAALTLSTAVLATGCESLSPRVYNTRIMHVDHQPHTPLDIINANGPIRAAAESRDDVVIEVEMYSRNEERLDLAHIRAHRQGDNTLRVWVEWPGGHRRSGEGASIEIYLPDAHNVSAKTNNGSITIRNLSGDANAQTDNGSIFIDNHAGDTFARTDNGSIRIDHNQGNIKFESDNGRVLIDQAHTAVQGQTKNGNVFIATDDENTGPVRVRTDNGRIELDLGPSFEGYLRINASNGKVRTSGLTDAKLIESSNHTLELHLADSEQVSAAKSNNGSIRVRGRSAD